MNASKLKRFQMTPRTDTKILNWWKIPECSQPFDPNVAAISSN